MGMPGTEPFFTARTFDAFISSDLLLRSGTEYRFLPLVYALLVLQNLPSSYGGAGRRRMEWELDDAVFKEAAGNEFMQEAIDVLKGVCAFSLILFVPKPLHCSGTCSSVANAKGGGEKQSWVYLSACT
jgi:hypothetical protein